jgi:signal transduction histidine kinase
MRFFFLFLFIIFFCQGTIISAKEKNPDAVKGVIDLRDRKSSEFFVYLNGEWEFYWKKLYRPVDFKLKNLKPDYFGVVPSYWTDYPQSIIKTEKFGYATYRLTVLLPERFRSSMGIDLPVFDSSYDIYIDGKYVGGNGTTGKSEEESKPEYKRNFFRINPVSDTLSIIINVSNYYHRRGGFWLPVKIGTFHEVQKQLANQWAADWSVISMLFGFSCYFILFFFISKKEKMMGFFSISTFGLALRPLFTSNFLILNIFDISWTWIIRFEYLSLYLIIIGWGWFVIYLYPSGIFRKVVKLITVFFLTAFLLTPFLPVTLFVYFVIPYYPLVVILIVYALYKSLIGALKRNLLDIMFFVAFFILLLAGIHDIRVSLGKSTSLISYLLTYYIVLFVFLLAGILLYRWVAAIKEKDRLKDELGFMNKNLENLVNERTLELQKRNEEIENQNSKIAQQNKQLSDTIQIKNRIFSVIAHDLRSPVVNILYMLNLLKEEGYKEKFTTYANSSIQYAQLVIGLLENMLVWGRGQEDKIKYSPDKHDLADIILTNLSIFKTNADTKDITLNFTSMGSSFAYIDKDLMDIIIRNLLSNAIKYTQRGGRISILVKNKKDGEIILKVCDNGIGIPANLQSEIFTKTEMESTPGTENEKGTGFGLKLCYDLVRLNNGTISIESNPGEGTCFVITLPARP